MSIDMDFVVMLTELVDKDTVDEKLINRFIKSKVVKVFINHENNMGREVDKLDMKSELTMLIKDKFYEDKYNFFKINKQEKELKKDIAYLKENDRLIIEMALKRVYKIIPEEMKVLTNIHLYIGGVDGGFTINRKDIYINYGNYIGKREEFIKILSHELYHSRCISSKHNLIFTLKSILQKNRYAYGLLGKIIEEGIACFIQHGNLLKNDDPTGNVTRSELLLSKIQFELLNEILLDIKHGRDFQNKLKDLNIYVVGYKIISTIYKEKGVLILDNWTLKLDFIKIFRKYSQICDENIAIPLLTHDVIDWIIE